MPGPARTFQRVLVAFDGSPSAEEALDLALRLRDPAAEDALVLAFVVTTGGWHLPGRRPDVEDAVTDALAMLAEARSSIPSGIHVRLRTPVAASAARGLTELAESERSDVIAIGSSKAAAGGRIGLARTAGRLLQGAPCAVAVAPPGLRERDPFRHVGVALDSSPEAAAALAAAFAVARASRSAVTLFSALDEITDTHRLDAHQLRLAIQELLDSAADGAPAGLNPRAILLHGPPGRVIAEACDGVVDLLVTGSRGYGPMQRALLGSVSEELIARARHPVLVIPRHPSAQPSAAGGAQPAEAI
jgi:nucleotide-binding universal stress UspA family protein